MLCVVSAQFNSNRTKFGILTAVQDTGCLKIFMSLGSSQAYRHEDSNEQYQTFGVSFSHNLGSTTPVSAHGLSVYVGTNFVGFGNIDISGDTFPHGFVGTVYFDDPSIVSLNLSHNNTYISFGDGSPELRFANQAVLLRGSETKDVYVYTNTYNTFRGLQIAFDDTTNVDISDSGFTPRVGRVSFKIWKCRNKKTFLCSDRGYKCGSYKCENRYNDLKFWILNESN